MPRFLLLLIALFYTLPGYARALDDVSDSHSIEAPNVTHPSSFAIIIDEATYQGTRSAVHAYRDALEEIDQLSAFLITGEWSSPEPIRKILTELANENPGLEGAVFIGEIPIPFIRDAQHLTSSFKMDQERFPFERSSVPSDRFYDDFDLRFDYINSDENNPLFHYYSLRSDSPQFIQSDIYTGRIKSTETGPLAHEMIASYLRKVVAYKKSPIALQHALFFTGHGYHSESLASWEGEAISLREQHPQFFRHGGRLINIYHYKEGDIKQTLTQQLQQPDLHLAVFHAHGTPEMQLLTGTRRARTLPAMVEALQYSLRNRYRSTERRNQSTEDLMQSMQDRFDIPESWFDGVEDADVIDRDAAQYAKDDFYTSDIDAMRIGARFVVFDQCFNGSFHQSPNISASYIFGTGNAIAALGHTVSVLQDSDANLFGGLLGHGIRVGYLPLFKGHLETHILGDPTFRFMNTASSADLNSMLAPVNRTQLSAWEDLSHSSDPNLQALSLHKIATLMGSDAELFLKQAYLNDESYIVRLQALKELGAIRSPLLHEVMQVSVNDPYEFIRRTTIGMMGDSGNPDFVPYIAQALVSDHSRRVKFKARYAMPKIDAAAGAESLEQLTADLPSGSASLFEWTIQSFKDTAAQRANRQFALISNQEAPLNDRRNAIRTVRLYRDVAAIPHLLEVIGNHDEPESLRITAAETAGWFKMNIRHVDIAESLRQIQLEVTDQSELYEELEKTIQRLTQRPNHPFTL